MTSEMSGAAKRSRLEWIVGADHHRRILPIAFPFASSSISLSR